MHMNDVPGITTATTDGTWGVLSPVEPPFPLRDDPMSLAWRAYSAQAITCATKAGDRIFFFPDGRLVVGAGNVTLEDVEAGVVEVGRVIEKGGKRALVRPHEVGEDEGCRFDGV